MYNKKKKKKFSDRASEKDSLSRKIERRAKEKRVALTRKKSVKKKEREYK